jgi:hypothetical protein
VDDTAANKFAKGALLANGMTAAAASSVSSLHHARQRAGAILLLHSFFFFFKKLDCRITIKIPLPETKCNLCLEK